MRLAGVVQAVVVAQQGAEYAAQPDQGCPVGIGAGQAAGLQAEDDADVVQTQLGQDMLEAQPPFGGLTAAPLVHIHDLDAVARPTEGNGQVGQGILPGRRLLVLSHLLRARLTDINNGFTSQMVIEDLGNA